jgi:hypothetical protein
MNNEKIENSFGLFFFFIMFLAMGYLLASIAFRSRSDFVDIPEATKLYWKDKQENCEASGGNWVSDITACLFPYKIIK